MKILYVVTKATWGGAQRYVYDLATGAQAAGDEVVVVVGGTGVLTERLAEADVRVIPIPLRQRTTFIGDVLSFGPVLALLRIFRHERPELVHVNSAKAGGLGAFAARLTGVPTIIFTAHGWEFNAPRSAPAKMGIRFFSWFTMLLAHRTIAVSDAIRNTVAHWPFIKRRITVIHNGIVCPALLSQEEARDALVPGKHASRWIGMISELHPTKCLDDAITAFAKIAEAHPDTCLVIIGDGRERNTLEKHILDKKLTGRVVLAGFRRNAETFLAAFDLFLHTASSEALGYVLLEAGCAGLPVVATRVGGVPEILPDDTYGLLVPAHDLAALAARMTTFLTDHSRAHATGHALHERVVQEFSLAMMLKKTFALYRS